MPLTARRWPLLERESELAAIGVVLDAAAAGSGRMLVLEGPPGVGKSRLLARAAELAGDRGLTTLTARGSELERDFPFGLAVQLFETALTRAGERERVRLSEGAAAHALPVVAPGVAGGPSQSVTGFAQLHGLYWLTANLAEGAPLLLCVDDLQWADTASLRFLLYLGSRLEDLPVALIAARRDGDALDPPALSEDLGRIHGVVRRRVEPLSRSGAADVVREWRPETSPAFAEACAELAAGNPLLLRELTEEVELRGLGTDESDTQELRTAIPHSVAEMARTRLKRLTPAAAAVARTVAVAGDPAPLWQVAPLSGLDAGRVSAAIDELVDAELLEGADPVAFVHPLIRMAVYDGVPAGERSSLHEAAAELLAGAGEPSSRVATHLLHTRVGDDPGKVAILAEAARDAAAKGAPELAIDLLRRALREGPGAGDRAELLLMLGGAAAAAGRAEAVDHLREAVEASGSPDGVATASLALGRALFVRGELAEAAAAFDRGIEAEPGRDLRMRLESEYCQVATLVPERVAGVGPRLRAALASIGDGEPLAGGRAVLATAALGASIACLPYEQALGLARRARGASGELVASETADGAAIYSVTAVLAHADELAEGIALADEAIADARARGSLLGFATASFVRSWYLLYAGRLGEAIADTDAAIEARRFGWHQYLPAAYGINVMALVESGDLDAAARRMAEVERDEERWRGSPVWVLALSARGRLRLARGESERALEDFLAWGELTPMRNPAVYSDWRSSAAEAHARLGELEQAEALALEELELAREFGAPRGIGIALRALGRSRRGEAAVEALRDAVSVLGDSQSALELCRARIELGGALRRSGQLSMARDELREGLRLADSFGARLLAARARDELETAGARPRRRELAGVGSLTPGELRVARMAAKKMTNREIAEALFVTKKAVQFHLGNIYRKLEVGSRDELPADLLD